MLAARFLQLFAKKIFVFNTFQVVLILFHFLLLTSSALPILRQGSSMSAENPDDVLISPSGMFSAGFYRVGQNAYCFAIWFSKPCHDGSHTIVWMANRDTPVNGRRSKLSVLKTGNIIITDAGQFIIWTSNNTVRDHSWSQLNLLDSGNLVLQSLVNDTLWQSFDSPTDTLLHEQPLTQHNRLVSARSQTDYSSVLRHPASTGRILRFWTTYKEEQDTMTADLQCSTLLAILHPRIKWSFNLLILVGDLGGD
ncbi:putative receptor protein kinase ZmPK1 [Gossypium hirsutum]|uniref:Receptor protein kinase ZmPK1 n=1 Tax=Gossypium hirsutum TaxID=3635 RepID=A0ABM3A144_GOSHI|nr:putative receptor protein kinase ZmPK1 [Gossypium hirsutum]